MERWHDGTMARRNVDHEETAGSASSEAYVSYNDDDFDHELHPCHMFCHVLSSTPTILDL
jgi:hypothetical protein